MEERPPAPARRARYRARRRLRPGRRRRPGAGAGRARAATSSTTSNPSCCSSATPPPPRTACARQLAEAGRKVDAEHPLFVYIPCGVGGAPGGITHGLKALYGDHVHCFFAEPVASPCMLVQLAAGMQTPHVRLRPGPDNRTEADGLAVGQASELVASLMTPQLGGVFTVSDDELYLNLLALKDSLDAEVEPRPPPPSRAGLAAGSAAGAYAQAWPWPTPRTSSGPLADRWCRVMRCAASRNTPGRCVRARGLSRHVPISRGYQAEPQQIPSRSQADPHTNNDIPRRQPVSASASLPAGRAATPTSL